MINKSMKHTLFLLSALAAVATTAVLIYSLAIAAEQRCGELGANCVCSEPLNTTNLVYSGAWYNPGDSTTKECTKEPFALPALTGFAVGSLTNVLTGSNDPIVLGRLPQRQASLQYFLRTPEGYTGTSDVAHAQTYAATRAAIDAVTPGLINSGARTEWVSKARIAARAYMYQSENFSFAGGNGGQCTNGKRIFVDLLSITHGYEPNVHIGAYDFAWDIDAVCTSLGLPAGCGKYKRDGPGGTQFAPDCCSYGPTLSDIGPDDPAEYRGKWWMFEWAVTNRFSAGWRLEAWIRNVTDNGPERKILDSNGSVGSGPGGAWTPSPNLTPGEINATGYFPLYIGTGPYRAGTCTGWIGQSHFMVAQWDTNTGQRIGPAYEVEGGSFQPPDTTLPIAPTGLHISAIWDQLLKVFSTLQ